MDKRIKLKFIKIMMCLIKVLMYYGYLGSFVVVFIFFAYTLRTPEFLNDVVSRDSNTFFNIILTHVVLHIFTVVLVLISTIHQDLNSDPKTSWLYVYLANVLNFIGVNIIGFAMLYWTGKFSTGLLSIWDCVYFSMITFTTIGYGDIAPIGNIKFVAGFQALSGYFLLSLSMAGIIAISSPKQK